VNLVATPPRCALWTFFVALAEAVGALVWRALKSFAAWMHVKSLQQLTGGILVVVQPSVLSWMKIRDPRIWARSEI
jgi:hypothetical protein